MALAHRVLGSMSMLGSLKHLADFLSYAYFSYRYSLSFCIPYYRCLLLYCICMELPFQKEIIANKIFSTSNICFTRLFQLGTNSYLMQSSTSIYSNILTLDFFFQWNKKWQSHEYTRALFYYLIHYLSTSIQSHLKIWSISLFMYKSR